MFNSQQGPEICIVQIKSLTHC